MENIIVVGDRVLIKRVEEEKKGLLLIPDGANEKPNCGVIVKMGDTMEVNLIGRKIIYKPYKGFQVIIDESKDEYLIIEKEDILIVI
jgi:co-chaperonin GroES (HSP10)